MFNMLTVAVLLPIEVAFGVLYNFSDAVKPQEVEKDNKWEGPLKKIVAPITAEFLIANKDVMKYVAQEKYTCKEIYSTHVDCSPDFNTSEYDSCSCSVHDEFYRLHLRAHERRAQERLDLDRHGYGVRVPEVYQGPHQGLPHQRMGQQGLRRV
mmetsp:Transcript_20143/g.42430  ORF Transcript_20143/g.42430 Transcript_20143/m.42430 type:complete len:153 (-) Transcript_20143:88-546(-)